MPGTLYAVGTIFVNQKGEILLLLRKESSYEGGLWGLVGGSLNNGEDKLEGAIREIKEEVGLDVSPSDLTFIKTYRYFWEKGDKNIVFETYKLNLEQDLDLNLDTQENVEYLWIKPKEAYERKDLMVGLYEILSDIYNFEQK